MFTISYSYNRKHVTNAGAIITSYLQNILKIFKVIKLIVNYKYMFKNVSTISSQIDNTQL